MRLIVVSLVLVLLKEANGGCPVKCTCTEISVNCISKNLEHVPVFERLDNSPVIIDISGNKILDITAGDFSFDKADDVREVYLNNSETALIEVTAFDELVNLQELYLGNNLLKDLPEDFVAYNENLILLDLSSNYFVDMPKINSNSLEVLVLSSCGVTTVKTDILSGLPNLKMLFLHQNNINYINPITFQNMPSGFSVQIAYNPWNCDCKTFKLFRFLNYRNFTNLTEPILCLERETKQFIQIYNNKSSPARFKECTKISKDDTFLDTRDLLANLDTTNEGGDDDQEVDDYQDDDKTFISYHYEPNKDVERVVVRCVEASPEAYIVYWYLVLILGIPLSFILGLIAGIFFAHRQFVKRSRSRSIRSDSSISGLLPVKNDLPYKSNV